MTGHTHCESKISLQDQTVDRLAFQYHSTPVELCPTTMSNGHSPCSNVGLFSREAIVHPLHDGQDMGIAGYGGVRGANLLQQCLPPFESHLSNLASRTNSIYCAMSNHKSTENEYALDYKIDDQEPV
jgi:hypothetical protein